MRKYLFGLVMFGVTLTIIAQSLGTAAQANSSPSPCGKNLIANGSFEQSPDPGSWRTLQAGSTGLEGWTVTHGSVDVVGSLWKASDGDRSIDLDGVSFGGISQTFDTVAGKRYVVTFDFAGNGHGAPIVKRLQVTAADQSAEFHYDVTEWRRLGWEVESFSFVAKAASTTLSFNSLDTENGYFGPVIDNVRVQTACE